jgi:DUF4097 and DUF4098 domain-containing protein YvlB
MSDQEMLFADPDWQPRHQAASSSPSLSPVQPANTAPTQAAEPDVTPAETLADRDKIADTAHLPYSSYEAGYQSRTSPVTNTPQMTGRNGWQQHAYQRQAIQPTQSGQLSRSKRRRWSQSPWLWSLIALLILFFTIFSPTGGDTLLILPRIILFILALSAIITSLAFVIQRGQVKDERQSAEIRTFSVSAQPKIIVKDDAAILHVHSGDQENQVVVKTTKSGVSMSGNPASALVQYEQNYQKNSISIKVKAGWHFLRRRSVHLDITVPHQANLDLKSEAGSISVSDVNGQMSLVSEAGSIRAQDVMLSGDSRLKTGAGSITFSGSLHPYGSYSMTADAGSVNVTLPAMASFRLDAKTDVGSINSHFPLVIKPDLPGAKARGDVGIGPYPPLKIRTDVGSINVWRG